MIRGERGSATLELALGVAVLVVPVMLLVAMLPVWLERHAIAELAAREAARAFVLEASSSGAMAAAHDAARRVVDGHGLDGGEWSLGTSGALSRGAVVEARVRVRVPSVTVPGLGRIGGFTITAAHREQVDRYRSW